MSKIDYTQLDAAILDRLANGPRALIHLSGGTVSKEAWRLSLEDSPVVGFKKPAFRFIDGRLQALRKKGLIAYDYRDGWMLLKQPVAKP